MTVIPLWIALSVSAGDPGPLCDALAEADAVAEIGFSSVGEYPQLHKRKRWEPPAEQVDANVATGRVLAVWKGDPALVGVTPESAWMGFSNQSAVWWERFFSGEPFAAVVFLDKTDGGWTSIGWIEDDRTCHASWCWDDLRRQIAECGVTVPEAADLTPFRTAAPKDPVPPSTTAPPPDRSRAPLCGCAS